VNASVFLYASRPRVGEMLRLSHTVTLVVTIDMSSRVIAILLGVIAFTVSLCRMK